MKYSPPARGKTGALVAGVLLLAAAAAAGGWFAARRLSPAAAPPSRHETPAPTPAPPPSPPPARPAPAAPADPLATVKRAVVTVMGRLSFEKGFSSGTGFFITPMGRLVTNHHVVRHTDFLRVLLPGSKTPIDAHVVALDEAHDLALLQAYVDPPVPTVTLARSVRLKMGDVVLALGSPAGAALEMSLTRGIVSADRPRQFGALSLIQHDAAINPGNSGGPLLNQEGVVVGMNTLKIKDAQGLSFAIPVDDVINFIEAAGR